MGLGQQQFLAVEYWGIKRINVRAVTRLPTLEIDQPALFQLWKRIVKEIRVVQQGNPSKACIKPYDIEVLFGPDSGPNTRFIDLDTNGGLEKVETAHVEIRPLGDDFTRPRVSCRRHD